MVDLSAVHSMLIEMHGGMLTLAAVCILGVIAARIHRRLRNTTKWYARARRLDTFSDWVLRHAEPTAFLAAVGGIIGMILSSIIGYYVWPAEEVLGTGLGLNKIMFSIFATELWIVFALVRARYGERLWNSRGLAGTCAFAGLGGFLLTVLTGSLGGHMAGKGSVLDPIYELLKVNPETPLVAEGWGPIFVLFAAELIIIVSAFLLSRAYSKAQI